MTDMQKTYQTDVLAPPTKEEKAEAHKIHQQILAIISEVKEQESGLEGNYVKLGSKLYTMQSKKYWIILGYSNWTEYFELVQKKYGVGKVQLYAYLNIAKTLLPEVSEENLVDMGVNKAKDLRKAMMETGKKPSQELLDKATDPQIDANQFRADVFKEFHIVDHNEKGIWFDFGGSYLTDEEKATLFDAFDLAKKLDPPISPTLPSHIQFKEVLLRLAQNFLAEKSFTEEVSLEG